MRKEKMADTTSCRTIIADVFKYNWPRYLIGLVISAFTTYANAQIPKLLGDAVDALSSERLDGEAALLAARNLILVSVFVFVTRFLWRYLVLGVVRLIELRLRQGLFSHLQTLSADFYDKYSTGDIITRNISDIGSVRMLFGMGFIRIIDTVVVTVVSLGYMLETVDVGLTLAAVLPLPFMVLLLTKLRKVMRDRYRASQETLSDLNAKTQENINGIRVIKAFAQEESEVELFTRLSKRKWAADMAAVKTSAMLSPASSLLFGLTFTAFLIIGGKMVMDGRMNIGQYVAFNGYLAMIMEPMNIISRLVQIWQRAKVSFIRLNEMFFEKPAIGDEGADMSMVEFDGTDIELDGLTFSYPGAKEPALSGVSLKIGGGSLLAIMGVTGSGKSTLADLLTRQRAVSPGMIRIGGRDINEIPVAVIRKKSAYVPQNSFLFSNTIAENIAFFDEEISDGQIVAAAKEACVHDNIISQPDGYDTVVGERGMTLSGGQKQRIAIARAIVRQPQILVLDDCLSAVDTVTEQAILKSLSDARGQRTTVFITHRVSAALAADAILLLDHEGRLAGFGSHEQLKAENAAYNELLDIISKSEVDRGGELH